MNYHIIPQDKFFSSYIEDIYRIHQEENNIIWVHGNKGESPFFSTIRRVEYLGNDPDNYRSHLSILESSDKLFVSWYDTFIGKLVLETNKPFKLYVYLMGAEFYCHPEWYHMNWLLDCQTKRILKQKRLYPQLSSSSNIPWLYFIYHWIKFKKRIHVQYLEKLQTIKRINYIILPKHSFAEFEQVKALYPGMTARHAYGCFDQNVDLACTLPTSRVPSEEDSIKVLLGNSADPHGNQFDAIHLIKSMADIPLEVFCLLSYGDEQAREWIIDYGIEELGSHFHPVQHYMDRESYLHFLQQMDIVIMYHNRSQAMGAIISSLVLGKPVFLKTQSPVYSLLVSIGVKSIYDVKSISSINLREVISSAQKNCQDTVLRIKKEFSMKTRLAYLSDLLR